MYCRPVCLPERLSTETQKLSIMVEYLTKTQLSSQYLKKKTTRLHTQTQHLVYNSTKRDTTYE